MLGVFAVVGVSNTALAGEVPDLERTGSISFTVLSGDEAVGGGTIAVFLVATPIWEKNAWVWESIEALPTLTITNEQLDDTSFAAEVAALVEETGITGSEISVGSNGKVVVSGLEVGLYLVTQPEAAAGYEAFSPFLVSIPMEENGTYDYDVDALPKTAGVQPIVTSGDPTGETSTGVIAERQDKGSLAVTGATIAGALIVALTFVLLGIWLKQRAAAKKRVLNNGAF